MVGFREWASARGACLGAMAWALAAGVATAQEPDKSAAEWLKEAKAAIERLQGAVGAHTGAAPSELGANLVSALAQAHRHTVAAAGRPRHDSVTALREVHAALIELARAEAAYRNLAELAGASEREGGVPVPGEVVLAGFAEARRCLSEASFAGHHLTAEISTERRSGRASVVLRNGGQRLVKAPRITLVAGRDWVATPLGKWTFTELPGGGERKVVFSLKPPEGQAGGNAKLVARISFYDFFARAVVEREQEAKLP
ncbi:MAG: hypothetical protein ACE5R4_01010 [Armatimonadota bacterium]